MTQAKEERLAYQRTYYATHKEKAKRYQRAYRAANREKIAVRRHAYYLAHREKIMATAQVYRANHREEKRAYDIAHREEIRAKAIAKHLSQRGIVLAYYGGKCACCGFDQADALVIDHIEGGGTRHRQEVGASNILGWLIRHNFLDGFQILCANCNMSKGAGEKCTLEHK